VHSDGHRGGGRDLGDRDLPGRPLEQRHQADDSKL